MITSTIKKGNQVDNLIVKSKCDIASIETKKIADEVTDLLIKLEEAEENTHDTRAFLMIEQAESCLMNAVRYLDTASDIINRTERANA